MRAKEPVQAIIGAYGFVLEGVTANDKMNEGPLGLFSYYKDDHKACEEVHMVHCKRHCGVVGLFYRETI